MKKTLLVLVALFTLSGCSSSAEHTGVVHGFSTLEKGVLYVDPGVISFGEATNLDDDLVELKLDESILESENPDLENITIGDEISFKISEVQDGQCNNTSEDLDCLNISEIKLKTVNSLTEEEVLKMNLVGSSDYELARDIYTELTKATTDTIDVNSKTPVVYYFYQPTCSHCNDNKANVTKFSDDVKDSPLKFEIVDLTDPANADLWYVNTGEYQDPKTEDPNYKVEGEIQTIEDLKIPGTPAAIYVNQGEVKSYAVGGGAIYDAFDMAAAENNITTTYVKN